MSEIDYIIVAADSAAGRWFSGILTAFMKWKNEHFSGPSSLDSVSATAKSENMRADAGPCRMAPDVPVFPKAMLSQKILIH